MTAAAIAIAESIYAEMESAALTDGLTFDDEQRGLIKQALVNAAIEGDRARRGEGTALARSVRAKVLAEVHHHWEFRAKDEAEFDEWLHARIREAEAAAAVPATTGNVVEA